MQNKIFLLKGQVQHYEWGGYDFIPSWLGIKNSENKPYAEYWMGAHPSASSIIQPGEIKLDEAITKSPADFLGNEVYHQFKTLPYLFKLLDVRDMLSIQVHPSKEAAEKGFDEEEKKGIPLNSPVRNFKDRNHKPEVMIALSEFWLLHGFKAKELMNQSLSAIKSFEQLLPVFSEKGYRALFEHVMYMDEVTADALLAPVVQNALALHDANQLQRHQPEYWIAKLYAGKPLPSHGYDKGLFSVYFLNIVHLQKLEGIFQAAGVPHAYLEGQNAELMANSDNVLRAGLTGKHIDVPVLIEHTIFEPVIPAVMKGRKVSNIETLYQCPVPEFSISAINLNKSDEWVHTTTSLEIFMVLDGEAEFIGSEHLNVKKGQVVAIAANEQFIIKIARSGHLFRAFTP
ncbi:MAG: manA [Chitinophagaceae bacterium]|nr:manA [Chitinophagaceae bacterium]